MLEKLFRYNNIVFDAPKVLAMKIIDFLCVTQQDHSEAPLKCEFIRKCSTKDYLQKVCISKSKYDIHKAYFAYQTCKTYLVVFSSVVKMNLHTFGHRTQPTPTPPQRIHAIL